MSDLISRSELLRRLEEWNTSDEMDKALYNFAFHRIIEQPTAYDIDKVVEELESFAKLAEDRWVNGTSKYAYQERKCWVKAIEIVKHGCASDDVCEWEKGSSGYVGYPAYYSKCCTTNSNGLEMQTHIIADWKYCPYCGKRIKVIGD